MTDAQDWDAWDTIEVGETLPSFSYVLTERMAHDYRRVVGNFSAAYPTVAARHPARAFYSKYEEFLRLPNMGQESWLFCPPEVGTKILVYARVVDKYIRRGSPYLVVEAKAVDDKGRLIEITRLIGMASAAGTPAFAKVAQKWEA